MMVKARQEKLTPQGALLSFLGDFKGSVSLDQMPFLAGNDWQERFNDEAKKVMKARIIGVDQVSKSVHLSLR